MFEELMAAYGGRLAIAVVGVTVGFICLAGVLWMLRGRGGPSPFIRGGKNRQPRLQVLDAAAVDTRRRLVLVRRDDVEHLVMIGGPTDIVIESGIQIQQVRQADRSAPPDRSKAVPPEAPAPVSRPIPRERAETAAVPAAPIAVPVAVNPQQRPQPAPAAAAPAFEPMRNPAGEARPAAVETVPADPQPSARNSLPEAPAAMTPAAPHAAPIVRNDLTEVLAAARGRVFQTPGPARTAPPDLAIPEPRVSAAGLETDFEQFLQQEMDNNPVPSREAIPPQPISTQPRPASPPPVTGATPEPSLQSEMARIFGEMSVTRDK